MHCHRSSFKYAITITFALLISSPAPGDDALVEAIGTAYEANRSAFLYSQVRFRFVVGTADLESALRGEISNASVAEGLYVFDGDDARYECVFSKEDTVAQRTQIGERRYTSTIGSIRSLTDGKRTLSDRVGVGSDDETILHTAQILPGTDNFYRELVFPLQLGTPSSWGSKLDHMIGRATLHPTGLSLTLLDVDEKARLDGRDVVLLTFQEADSAQSFVLQRRLYVDLERGAIPLRRVTSMIGVDGTTTLIDQIDCSDLRYIAGRGWFPFRMTIYVPERLAKQLVIEEADFESRPDRSLFALKFPKPIRMVDQSAMVRYEEPRTTWSLKQLPSASAPGVQRITMGQPSEPPPSMPGEREPAPWWAGPLLAFGVVLLIIAVVSVLRRRGLAN